MSTLPNNSFITPEQYLELDRKAEFKSEYYDGEMFAMSGATYTHNTLAANVLASLHSQLRGAPCAVIGSDLRVRIGKRHHYTYPDVTIVCGQPQFLDGHLDTLLNPAVIVEVLSPSTESYDRGKKFERYGTIESLRQYVLVASDRISVQVFTRGGEGEWTVRTALGADESVELEAIGCRLLMTDVYERVEFPAQEAGA